MAWIGLIVGIVLGGAIGRWPGALAGGFLGWLVGFIIAAQRQPKVAVPLQAGTPRPERSVADRLDAIERRLAALERAVSSTQAATEQPTDLSAMLPTVEPIVAPAPVVAPAEAVVPAEAGTQRPERSETIIPASPPPQPDAPLGPLDSGLRRNDLVAWFLGGNTIVRVGLLVLFLGLGFLVKYGVEHQLIPVELRVAAVGAAGLALLIVGWRLRFKREGYALSLQGAGVAVLYLTIFGALKLYHLIPPGLSFALLVAITALSAVLAVKQDSLVFAVFAAAGGFLAPVLASTGQGNHVLLFSYYILLNASIIAIAWFKAWRLLNLVGFLFTALIGTAWGVRSYQPELFASTEPFLIAFFLMYVAIAILFARKASEMSQPYVDGTLVFGTPIFAFGLQAGMMKNTEMGLAFSAIAMAGVYVAAATALMKAGRERWKLLAESFLALGVVFASLAIPLALDARWTSAAWAMEGAAVMWIGLREGRKVARAFGLLLQIGAGVAFFHAYPTMPPGPPLADALFVGAIIMALTGFFTWRLLASEKADTAAERVLSPIFFLWGIAWLVVAGGHEIETFVTYGYRGPAWIAFFAAVALVFGLAFMRRGWKEARWPTYALAPLLLVFAAWIFFWRPHLFANFGWLAWTFAIAVDFFLLARVDLDRDRKWTGVLHVLSVALVAFVFGVELEWLAAQYTANGTAWALASRLVVPALLILWISSPAAEKRWPVRDLTAVYRIGAVGVLVAVMALWSLHVNWAHAGGSDPLPYIPVLNALDLAHILGIIAIVTAVLAARRSGLWPPAFMNARLAAALAGILAFIWANSMLLRTIHHWADVPYRFEPLMRSVLVQASLSVFWSFLALGLMVYATRRGWYALWMTGAGLMAVVIVKLVLVDFSHLAGIERIVSFIGVGVLMLIIGYFSPVPPRRTEAA